MNFWRVMELKPWLCAVLFISGAFLYSPKSDSDTPQAPAQMVFPQTQIQVGSHPLIVEVADTEERRRRGLMFRKSLPQEQGMLFVFPQSQLLRFWMKNTFIPLSIAFIDENNQIVDIQDMEPAQSVMERAKTYTSQAPGIMALEVNKGWFEAKKIKAGDRIVISNPKISPLLLQWSKQKAGQRSSDPSL